MDWDLFAAELKKAVPGLELRRNEPMSRHTSFRVGGPAALMVLPKTVEETQAALRLASDWSASPFFLGNGSNLLVNDAGYDGLVVKPAGAYQGWQPWGRNTVISGCAMPLSKLANQVMEAGFTGLEFAAGIPGTVGGAVTMNAGAYGGEIAQVLRQVEVMGPDGSLETINATQCELSYRHSIFMEGKYLIVEAIFHLKLGDPAEIKATMDDLAARRREKQPLEYPSAGSAFKRPEGHYAAALIDQCGLKGLTVGGAQVSEKHAGFIINRGGATCADILALVEQVKSRVLDETGVTLELEIKTLGV